MRVAPFVKAVHVNAQAVTLSGSTPKSGGSVAVRSSETEGTVFPVTLPEKETA